MMVPSAQPHSHNPSRRWAGQPPPGKPARASRMNLQSWTAPPGTQMHSQTPKKTTATQGDDSGDRQDSRYWPSSSRSATKQEPAGGGGSRGPMTSFLARRETATQLAKSMPQNGQGCYHL